MNEQDKIRLAELRWKNERENKLLELDRRLKEFMSPSQYSFVSFDESDTIQKLSEDWPGKSEEQLNLIEINPYDFSYVFFMNYNFGLVKVNNDALFTKWPGLIEIDSDMIFCYIPDQKNWICVERTDQFLPGKEQLGVFWIYEITFSDMAFKTKLLENAV